MAEAFAIVTVKLHKKKEKKIYLYERENPPTDYLNLSISNILNAVNYKNELKRKKKKIPIDYLYMIIISMNTIYIEQSSDYGSLVKYYYRYEHKTKIPNFDILLKLL